MRRYRGLVWISSAVFALALSAPRLAGACADPLPAGIGAELTELPGGFRVTLYGGSAFGSNAGETCGCAFAVPAALTNTTGCTLDTVTFNEPISGAFGTFSPDPNTTASFTSLMQGTLGINPVDYTIAGVATVLSNAVSAGASLTILLDYACPGPIPPKIVAVFFKHSGIIGTGPLLPDHTIDFSQPTHIGVSEIRSTPGCQKKKLDCAAKKAYALFNCHAKAEKTGLAVDPICIQKAEDKFDGGANPLKGCFVKAEKNGGCLSAGNTAPVEAQVDAFIDDVVTDLDPGYPAPVTSICSAAKKACAAKKMKAILGCYAKAENKTVAVDPICISKAVTKFNDCFAKAELRGDCLTLSDVGPIETKVDAFINDILCAIDPATCP
jgi:hypothetical protein